MSFGLLFVSGMFRLLFLVPHLLYSFHRTRILSEVAAALRHVY